jgi:hypothetical protein
MVSTAEQIADGMKLQILFCSDSARTSLAQILMYLMELSGLSGLSNSGQTRMLLVWLQTIATLVRRRPWLS